MQHEAVCRITCAGRSPRGGGEGGEVERKGSVALRNHSPCRLTSPGGATVCFPHPPEVCGEWCVCVCVMAEGGKGGLLPCKN